MGVLYIKSVEGHPTSPGDLRLTYNEAAVVSQAEALANYNGGLTAPVGVTPDANTYALYRLNEATAASNALDSSGNALDLTQAGSPSVVTNAQVGGGRQCTTLNQGFSRTGVAGDTTVFAGALTLQWWSRWDGGASPTGYQFPLIYANVPPSTPQHYIFYVDIIAEGTGSDGCIRSLWNAGANGTLQQQVFSPTFTARKGAWCNFAVRHRLVTTFRYVDFFRNGQLVSTQGPFPVPNITVTGALVWQLARNTLPATYTNNGVLDEVHLSKVARSDAEILGVYNASKYGIHVVSGTTPANSVYDITGISASRGSAGTVTVTTVQDAATTTPIVTNPNGISNYIVFGENSIPPASILASDVQLIGSPPPALREVAGESSVPALLDVLDGVNLGRVLSTDPDYVPPAPPVSTSRFVMRAYHIIFPVGHVYWSVDGAPDPIGAFAPYPLVELSDIVVAREYIPA